MVLNSNLVTLVKLNVGILELYRGVNLLTPDNALLYY